MEQLSPNNFERDDTSSMTPKEAEGLSMALAMAKARIVPAAGVNVERFPTLPDSLNTHPIELLAAFGSPSMYTSQEIYGVSDGTNAAETFDFSHGTADTKITTNGQGLVATDQVNRACLGVVLDISYEGPDNADLVRATIGGASVYGAVSIVTDIRSAKKGNTLAVILFHANVAGQFRLAPTFVGRDADQAQQALGAWAAATDNSISVALTGCLNKTIKVSLLNGSMPQGRTLVADLIKVSK